MQKRTEDIVTTTVRLPKDLFDYIKEVAGGLAVCRYIEKLIRKEKEGKKHE